MKYVFSNYLNQFYLIKSTLIFYYFEYFILNLLPHFTISLMQQSTLNSPSFYSSNNIDIYSAVDIICEETKMQKLLL